jgi:hypothetical protein
MIPAIISSESFKWYNQANQLLVEEIPGEFEDAEKQDDQHGTIRALRWAPNASRSSRNLLSTADTTLPFTSFSQYPTPAGAPAPVRPIAPPPVPPLPVPPPISERQLVERLEFDMLFRWFVGLSIDERVFDASTFSKNRRHARGRARVSVVAPRSAGGEGADERRAFFGRRDFA